MRNPLRRFAFVVCVVATLAQNTGHAAPPYSGTIFLDPDIITAADPNAITGISYEGIGRRRMYDRRPAAFIDLEPFLFHANYVDAAAPIEVQVNPEFGTKETASAVAEKYAVVVGHLPAILRSQVRTMWIHKGVNPFGGGNNNLLIHVGQAEQYEANGILEETLVHEASHTSLDASHANAAGWVAAQRADVEFISTYARDYPIGEDIAESFLPYLMVRHRRDKITAAMASTIERTMPNRISYFDQQGFNLSPFATGAGGVASNVSFPPRNESNDFFNQLIGVYQNELRAGQVTTYVDPEGIVVWLIEYARYRVGLCGHSTAQTRVFSAIDNTGVSGVCAPTPSGTIPFPPRNEGLDFMNALQVKYRDDLQRGAGSSYVNNEGAVVWVLEYLRYRLNGCGHGDATTKVFMQIRGQGVQPVCR